MKKEPPRIALALPLGVLPGSTNLLKIRGVNFTNASLVRFSIATSTLETKIKSNAKVEVPKDFEAKKIGDTELEVELKVPPETPPGAEQPWTIGDWLPLAGVGLMYTRGYFDQHLSTDGWQEDRDEKFDFQITPLVQVFGPGGDPWLTSVNTYGRPVFIGAWKMMVGRVPLYLLDTNLEENDPQDRELSSKLYGGGLDLRLRQEWILGVGGVRTLRAVGIDPGDCHAIEGHAAFMFV